MRVCRCCHGNRLSPSRVVGCDVTFLERELGALVCPTWSGKNGGRGVNRDGLQLTRTPKHGPGRSPRDTRSTAFSVQMAPESKTSKAQPSWGGGGVGSISAPVRKSDTTSRELNSEAEWREENVLPQQPGASPRRFGHHLLNPGWGEGGTMGGSKCNGRLFCYFCFFFQGAG